MDGDLIKEKRRLVVVAAEEFSLCLNKYSITVSFISNLDFDEALSYYPIGRPIDLPVENMPGRSLPEPIQS
jgi:hypothetical protein